MSMDMDGDRENDSWALYNIKVMMEDYIDDSATFDLYKDQLNYSLCRNIEREIDREREYRDWPTSCTSHIYVPPEDPYEEDDIFFMAVFATQGKELQKKIFEMAQAGKLFPNSEEFLIPVTEMATGSKEERKKNHPHLIWLLDQIMARPRKTLKREFYMGVVHQMKQRQLGRSEAEGGLPPSVFSPTKPVTVNDKEKLLKSFNDLVEKLKVDEKKEAEKKITQSRALGLHLSTFLVTVPVLVLVDLFRMMAF